jgi:hypothetical protein
VAVAKALYAAEKQEDIEMMLDLERKLRKEEWRWPIRTLS